tara:strand:+ start:253 stop:855 length:603 start_codon:yes stop_codon:yes gene_type:complete
MEISDKLKQYYGKDHPFMPGINTLRDIANQSGLEETFKWNCPTYTYNGQNVLAICRFKYHFGIWFFKGVFLSDPHAVLQNAQEGKTKAMRHWKFTSNEDIDTSVARSYMVEALENEKRGVKLAPKKNNFSQTDIPVVLREALHNNTSAQKAYDALSPYNRRIYAAYIAEAKQERTKISRLAKIIPMILEGKGLNDAYKKH